MTYHSKEHGMPCSHTYSKFHIQLVFSTQTFLNSVVHEIIPVLVTGVLGSNMWNTVKKIFASPFKNNEEKEKKIKKIDSCKDFCATHRCKQKKQLQSMLGYTQTQKFTATKLF